MKKNKIMALAMLCSTLLSPVSKAHGGTKQGTEKSDIQNDSDKNLQNILNKKSDNPQEMYESRWKTNDIVKYIEYFFGTVIGGGVLGYGGKKVYNKYILNPKIKPEKMIEKIKPEKIIKKIEPKEELTIDSIAKKIKKRFTFIGNKGESSKRMRRVYNQVIESYKSQKNNKFQEIVETKIPDDKHYCEQFITWFQELNNDALNILLEGLTNEEQKIAKDSFKFYSFVWVSDDVDFVIAFAPKEKQINLEGAKGNKAFNFDDEQLFGANFWDESYDEILKYCEINE